MRWALTWLICALLVAGCATTEQTPSQATAVITDYYRAINAHDYARAYAYWDANGAASGHSFEEFRQSLTDVRDIRVTAGTPSPVEGAAGSRFITVPVTVVNLAPNGARTELTGTYDLRYSVADGATEAQRHWHLYRFHPAPVRP